MFGPPTTRASLLVRLRDAADAEAWKQFVRLYAPLVYRYGRRHGLQDADAADLTQEVLRGVSTALRRDAYDAGRGPFRAWLFTIAHHRLHDLLARQRRPGRGSGDSDVRRVLEEQPAPADTDFWEQAWRQRVFAWAAERVRPTVKPATWEAFRRTAVEDHDPAEVARELGMTLAAVYLARSRVLARLKEEVRRFEAEQEN